MSHEEKQLSISRLNSWLISACGVLLCGIGWVGWQGLQDTSANGRAIAAMQAQFAEIVTIEARVENLERNQSRVMEHLQMDGIAVPHEGSTRSMAK